MRFTDIFVKRPVLAMVVSLLILVVGLRSLFNLSIREFPFTENGILTVVTNYIGANPEIMASFVTSTLESAVSVSNGIEYMTSVSQQGVSTISVFLRQNYDTDKAMTEINSNVTSVLSQLPPDAQTPGISIDVGEATDMMYLGFYSDVLNRNQISDYIYRIAQPKIRAVNQVLDAEVLGLRQFALRAWLDPDKLASYNLTANDVFNALDANDFLAAAGRSDGQMVAVNIMLDTSLKTVDEFRDLVIEYQNGALIKLEDVGEVELASENYDSAVSFDGKDAVYIGIQVVPNGNVLEVINNVREVFEDIQQELPEGLKAEIVYDATDFIYSSIKEVIVSLFQAMVIVILVIFIFLGTLRSVAIPVVAIPLSLIGTFLVMLLLGYSVNILTLLALVLSIGLVVDDAIIVLENIERHMRGGMSPFDAAIQGARELANPIIAITVVLVAVYLPIGFMGGLTGTLFTEFAFTLAGAVAISAVIALTLSPMMCSRLLKPVSEQNKNKFSLYVDHQFQRLHHAYQQRLEKSLDHINVTRIFAVIVLCSLVVLYMTSKTELAPDEDQGLILAALTMAPNASVYQTSMYSQDFYRKMMKFKENEHVFQMDGLTGNNGSIGSLNTSLGGIVLQPWDERARTSSQLLLLLEASAATISGAKVGLYQPSPLPGTVGLPIQFAIITTKPYAELFDVSTQVMNAALASGLFHYLDNDLKMDMLQATLEIDRYKTASLGLQLEDVGNVITAAYSQNYVNFFAMNDLSYQVIPQLMRDARLNYDQILDTYITTASGDSVKLDTIASIKTEVVPESLNHFHELHSATISAVANPGVTMGTALEKLEAIAEELLPDGYDIDYAGESRQYQQEKTALLVTFMFSMIIIFLSLSALFESFRDPVIILISVPMSIFGALLFVNLGVGGASLNIYTQVGLVTLIGLISKHGILIVQFANTLQAEGKNKREAIITAAGIRLRPILMTTGAMVLGVIPLILATGAGAESRFNIGLVIATGISIGTLFTLFVVPAMYLMIGKRISRVAPA